MTNKDKIAEITGRLDKGFYTHIHASDDVSFLLDEVKRLRKEMDDLEEKYDWAYIRVLRQRNNLQAALRKIAEITTNQAPEMNFIEQEEWLYSVIYDVRRIAIQALKSTSCGAMASEGSVEPAPLQSLEDEK